MSGLLTGTYQVGAKKNAVLGVAEALAAADFSIESKSPAFTRMTTKYERNVGRPSLSRPKSMVGGKYGKLDVTVELAGGGKALADRVAWWDMIEMSGFYLTIMKLIVAEEDTVPAKFVAGETFGNNAVIVSATATGKITYVGLLGGVVIVAYIPLTGTFADGDTLTSYRVSGGAGTLTQDGAPVDAGPAFRLKSETASQVPTDGTVEYRDGEDINRIICRGNADLMFNWGECPLAKFNFEGPRVMQTFPGTPVRGGFVANVPTPASPRYLQGDVGFPTLLGAFAPIFEQATFAMGNTLTPQKSTGIGGVTQYLDGALIGGYADTRITARAPKLTIDPNRPGYATFDWMKIWQENTEFPVYMQNGLIRASGDSSLILLGPRTTIDDDNLGDTDKNNIRAISGNLKLNGDYDDELILAHVWAAP